MRIRKSPGGEKRDATAVARIIGFATSTTIVPIDGCSLSSMPQLYPATRRARSEPPFPPPPRVAKLPA